MIDFLLAPVLSFFSSRFYKKISASGAGFGFAYLLYLSLLFALLAVFLCRFLLIPIVSNFSDWLIHSTPEIQVTAAGLNANVKQPFLLKHPALGPLYLIDTTKPSNELLSDPSGAPILIGKDQIFVRTRRQSEVRMYRLDQAMEQIAKTHQPLMITRPLMQMLSSKIRQWVVPVALIIFVPLFFLWKLISALIYVLVALILNLARKEKLRFGTLFTFSCLAITPITIIQWMSLSIPELQLNVNLLLSFGLTTAYLAYGLLVASR